MLVILVFLSPLFAMGWEEPFETDTSKIVSVDVAATNHIFVEIDWGTEGSLIYWYMEVSGPLDFYIIDSADFDDITDEIWDREAVFSTLVESVTEHDIVLPYDDTFYFAFFNRRYSSVALDGWYAKDETEPDGKMWGMRTNFASEVLIGSTADLSCLFTDHFDIVNVSLYEDDVLVRNCTEPVDTMVVWSVDDYKFTTLGTMEIAFKAEDLGGNIGVASKTIKVVNKLSKPPTITEPEYFDWVGIFEEHWVAMIVIGTLLGTTLIVGLEKAGKLP